MVGTDQGLQETSPDLHAQMTSDEKYLLANRKTKAQAYAARVAGALSDAQIREIFLAHGFTVKEGQVDLKPYVYAAARALLAAAEAPTVAQPVQWPRPTAFIQTDRPRCEDDPLNHELVWAGDHDGDKDQEPLYTKDQVQELLMAYGVAC